jgi:DNA-binding winged helix-turn-helix (wHTH) protein
MASPGTQSGIIRFGPFELDPANRELRKRGNVIKLRPQQVAVLLLMVERDGQIVSREEIHQCVWGNDTFVDFERGINFAINQIRAALGDEADDPRFVETIPRRGYRFIAQLEGGEQGEAGASSSVTPMSSGHPEVQVNPLPAHVFSIGRILISCGVLFLPLAALLILQHLWSSVRLQKLSNTAINAKNVSLTTYKVLSWWPGPHFPRCSTDRFCMDESNARQTDIYVQLIWGDRPPDHPQPDRDGNIGAN